MEMAEWIAGEALSSQDTVIWLQFESALPLYRRCKAAIVSSHHAQESSWVLYFHLDKNVEKTAKKLALWKNLQ